MATRQEAAMNSAEERQKRNLDARELRDIDIRIADAKMRGVNSPSALANMYMQKIILGSKPGDVMTELMQSSPVGSAIGERLVDDLMGYKTILGSARTPEDVEAVREAMRAAMAARYAGQEGTALDLELIGSSLGYLPGSDGRWGRVVPRASVSDLGSIPPHAVLTTPGKKAYADMLAATQSDPVMAKQLKAVEALQELFGAPDQWAKNPGMMNVYNQVINEPVLKPITNSRLRVDPRTGARQ